MCRIVGILNYTDMPVNLAGNLIDDLTDQLTHGGPDDRGTYIDEENRVVLGHRRLSIIDLSSAGNQPMPNDEKTVWLVFNGEIYNFREIRSDLSALGHYFRSKSDTEVILKSYIEWGTQCFEKFKGMFSFCLYDRRIRKSFLVRDQSGIKPLYYSFKNKSLVFSSEIKSFRRFDRQWNQSSEWQIYFLTFGFVPEPYTILDNVFMLPPGNYLEFDHNKNSYRLQEFDSFSFTDERYSAEEVVENIEKLVEQSVKRHLVSDAPIGVFLSGGIDSSIISFCASRFQGEDLNTLSVIFDENGYSEQKYQDMISRRIGSKHSSFLLEEEEFMGSVDNIFTAMDQPTIDGINTYFISKYARESGLKTVLSGIGGDELFGGYPSFNRMRKLWHLEKVNNGFKKAFSAFEFLGNEKIKKFSFLSLKKPLNYYLLLRGLYNMSSVSRILDTDRKDVIDCIEKLVLCNIEGLDSQNTASCLESDMYMKNQLLRDTDFMSMRNSVEVRVPFLDQDLVRYVYSLDTKIKFNSKVPKILLHKAFSENIPEAVMKRKKQGFVFPFELWMRRNADHFAGMINIKNKEVNRAIENFRAGNLHWSRFWSLVVLSRKS